MVVAFAAELLPTRALVLVVLTEIVPEGLKLVTLRVPAVTVVAVTPELITLLAVIEFVMKLPRLSRLTIAFTVFALVGATVHPRFSVPDVVIGELLTVKSEVGAAKPTLVTVPAPGKV